MASATHQDDIDFFLDIIKQYEPYPIEMYRNMAMCDGDDHDGDPRFAASICLNQLIDIGFSEDEVNPWKKKD